MKTIKYLAVVMAALTLPSKAFCSDGELRIGDKMPDLALTNVLNSSNTPMQLSSLTHGRTLIIDFFATWCGSCLTELPKLEAYQNKYGDKLQILVVSNESKSTVAGFLKRRPDLAGLPFVFGDNALGQLFPHRELPHEVWIDKSGIVKEITTAENITDQNLKEFFDGTLQRLKVKKDILDYNEDVPLFKDGNGTDGDSFISRSVLTKGIDGINSFSKIDLDANRQLTRFIVMNNIPLRLFYDAYSRLQFGSLNFNRVVIDPADSAEILNSYHLKGSAKAPFLVTYEYIPPKPESFDEAFGNIFNDLNRYFDISGTVEKRSVPCWVLVLKDKTKLKPASNSEQKVYGRNGAFHNVALKYFVNALQWYYQMEPVVDETGYVDPVYMDIQIAADLNHYPDISSIRQKLAGYGLDLVKENRSVNVLVIKKKAR
ncbi:MAG: redoxin family protein [Bacteroidetes bacterium]|nr:redoxin family protein [Bacteroidota bacterium]